MGATMASQNPGPGVHLINPALAPSAAYSLSGVVTVVMSQHLRPETLERQYRTLRSAGIDEGSMICWVNPAGVRLNDAFLGKIPHVRASTDMGPMMRWSLTSRIPTKYTLIIDDDCLPGPQWPRSAIERLERAEAEGHNVIVAAAGMIFQSDRFDDWVPVGPEATTREEMDVDLGRGAWLMRTDRARLVDQFPQLGSPLATPLHIAATMQHEGVSTIVLPYPHVPRDAWGMLEVPKPLGSMSSYIDRMAGQGQSPGSGELRRGDYEVYRDVWEPLCVMRAAAATMREHTVPVSSKEVVDAQA
jgi:hypothetical protein